MDILGKYYYLQQVIYLLSSYEIEIPEYDSKDILREKILIAIFEGVDGFYIG